MLKNKNEIELWLKKYNIKSYNYSINDDLTVNVKDGVNLSGNNLTEIPVQFNKINGNFSCSHNNLTSLKGCPKEVTGYFDCGKNQLTSLEFCPQKIGKTFDCSHNNLINLEFCPSEVKDFYCSHNDLFSFLYCPTKVKMFFVCKNNNILGDLQNITDFNIIFNEHKKELIIKNKEDLEHSLKNKSKIKKINKI
jgi:hypothetical protein